MKLEIVKNSKTWFLMSGLLASLSLAFILISFAKFSSPVKLGLDFTGGSKIEYVFKTEQLKNQTISSEAIQGLLSQSGLNGTNVQIAPEKENTEVILRTQAVSDDPSLDKFNKLLAEQYGSFQINSIDTVSPIIGPELFTSAITSLIITILGIVIYISTRFTRDYAFSAIAALIHDVFISLGLFAFLGVFFNVEVDSLFITALLTIFGFSVHDTIVVFDRIRENQKLQSKSFNFIQIVELSIQQVFQRSLNTSLTVLTVLAVLFFFGGASTALFAGALFFGLFIGTYSSLFIASPILVKLKA